MDPLGAVCSMTNPNQSNQISMTNFARSQQKKIAEKLRKSGRHCWAIWGNFEPFWFTFWPFWVIFGPL